MQKSKALYFSIFIIVVCLITSCSNESHQATGAKIGEVTHNSAIIWVRVTKNATRNYDGKVLKNFNRKMAKLLPKDIDINSAEGACPGKEGKVRLKYGTNKNLLNNKSIGWIQISETNDFTYKFKLQNLKPHTKYFVGRSRYAASKQSMS